MRGEKRENDLIAFQVKAGQSKIECHKYNYNHNSSGTEYYKLYVIYYAYIYTSNNERILLIIYYYYYYTLYYNQLISYIYILINNMDVRIVRQVLDN